MEYDVCNTMDTVSRELADSELDTVCGGMSQMIAAGVAALLNAIDPTKQCVAADHHVVCQH